MLRDYGFDLEEMPFTSDGNLPLSTDPKLAWAKMNLREKPIEINRAEKRELLRVPGIGPKGADAILKARRMNRLRDVSTLKKLGIIAERATPYLLLDGKRAGIQLAMF